MLKDFIDIETMASQFLVDAAKMSDWIDNLSLTQNEVEFCLAHFEQKDQRQLICLSLRPSAYLANNTVLIKHCYQLATETVKSLPEAVFKEHLAQLIESDKINDKQTGAKFPHNSQDADIFMGLRYMKKQVDLNFIRGMAYRNINHPTYPIAKEKLKSMVADFKHPLIS